MFFSSLSQSTDSQARSGLLNLSGVEIPTPVFMPVGTQATIKGVFLKDVAGMGYRLILSNTYHLFLRQGYDLAMPLHTFMNWPHAVLTDSGGYQAFSLAGRVKLSEQGVQFQSHIDGKKHLFTPESVVDYQNFLGSDIAMPLDDCPPAQADLARLRAALQRTRNWARQSLERKDRLKSDGQLSPRLHLFGIHQGGCNIPLRLQSMQEIQELPFAGIAAGGLSVGESRDEFRATLESMAPELDPSRPRYLMGVGTIPDFLLAVSVGFDMFDCVLPTRNARNGQALTMNGPLNIRNARFSRDGEPLDPACGCHACQGYSRAYLRHLFVAREMLGPMLISIHNLFFYFHFMRLLRESIEADRFSAFRAEWLLRYQAGRAPV
ncbi:MAG: tRNA guanosine(34) transglycosylase Tgt [Spirochaetales bacterium]|nr:tRNA guanosine(34) transglycosylase Tgt [Spirochaetales bacterium]